MENLAVRSWGMTLHVPREAGCLKFEKYRFERVGESKVAEGTAGRSSQMI